ncbi:ATPase component of various ABC-type transport systems with duplicated ATPase domain [Pseudarthrobacter phenanthrenivorans Sphe3]|uniref:ATPase component of various ABC-type transport systems with duplicated ATPase domain n=1 Tax=Pseudarthrobacter phenanthrenivorans (strain DSM 18606 / JCM 16027 / LMG 23796 / Sphe3) TaxID=930171 RepID=F0M9S5_PSEPM|nr:ATP-binding cassette domain-containing protein [Pseudarthrobacter phenanthrenivorans]ADX72795.1 ATPase component of various ABC-type transport systems with duplicated ATPase domain [Pseudarthrobacter phenanthrenivorans Sphe3]
MTGQQDTPPAARPVLSAGIRTFTFHDDAAPVLEGLQLDFTPGTFTAILGPSGSGKSTLGWLLAGWLPPGGGGELSGFLELAGTRLQFGGNGGDPRINPAEWGKQVGFVPQDPAAVLSTVRSTVAEELAFGLENAAVDRATMVAAVQRTAARLGLAELLDQDPARLSGGQLRRLAIGCAIIADPRVLIMDEPFASLDSDGAAGLARLVRDLVNGGTAVVILSQAIDPPLLEARTWLVLAGGRVTASGTPAALAKTPDLLPPGILMSGKKAARLTPAVPPGRAAGPAVELRAVSFGYRAATSRAGRRDRGGKPAGGFRHQVLQEITLAVHPGEIVAVTGPNGAGKSTLLRHLNGLLRPTAGQVLVQGRDIAGTPAGQVAQAVGLLFQQPRDQLFERTVLREVGFGLDRLFPAGEALERAHDALASVGLAAAAHAHPAELPASSQRLLALATVLARRPSVLALDEPTVALDGCGRAVLDAAVRSAAGAGAAVVLVTHDLDYARAAAHRMVRLDGGRLAS